VDKNITELFMLRRVVLADELTDDERVAVAEVFFAAVFGEKVTSWLSA
jgi:hypothetical protein